MSTVLVLFALVAAPPSSATVPDAKPKPSAKKTVQPPERCGPLIDTAAERLESGVAILTHSKQKEDPTVADRQKRFGQWIESARGPLQNVKRMSHELHTKLTKAERKACVRYGTSRFRAALQTLASPKVRRDFSVQLRQLGTLFR